MPTLTDAGPLVALIDRGEERHKACVAVLPILSAPLVTTWSCFTEAMHLLYYSGGRRYRMALWSMVKTKRLTIYNVSEMDAERMAALMEKYGDVPMDLADASLVAAAESLRMRRVFTLDGDFRIYRASDREHFEVVP